MGDNPYRFVILSFIFNTIGKMYGGETGIRTLETVSRLHTFQACAFDHSATSPVEVTYANF